MRHARLSIEFVRDEAAFTALADEWWALWRRANAPPFLAPAWLLPWRRAFRAGRLLSSAVRVGGRLVALAPFYIEDGALKLPHSVDRLRDNGGCAELHFLRGRASYKYDWGAADVWSVRRVFVRDTVSTGKGARYA